MPTFLPALHESRIHKCCLEWTISTSPFLYHSIICQIFLLSVSTKAAVYEIYDKQELNISFVESSNQNQNCNLSLSSCSFPCQDHSFCSPVHLSRSEGRQVLQGVFFKTPRLLAGGGKNHNQDIRRWPDWEGPAQQLYQILQTLWPWKAYCGIPVGLSM